MGQKGSEDVGSVPAPSFSSETPGVRSIYMALFSFLFFSSKYGINCVFSIRLTNKSFAIIIIFIDEHY